MTWNRRIDWAGTVRLNQLTAGVPGGEFTEVCRVTEDEARVWLVQGWIYVPAGSPAPTIEIVTTMGNGRITWQQHDFVGPIAVPSDGLPFFALQVPAKNIVVQARFTAVGLAPNPIRMTGSIAPYSKT